MAQHIVQTTHIQRLIRNGLELAEVCDGIAAGDNRLHRPVEHTLQKAAADLRHAAEELEAERLSVLGWAQV